MKKTSLKHMWILLLIPFLNSCVITENNSSLYESNLESIEGNNFFINGTFECSSTRNPKYKNYSSFYIPLNESLLLDTGDCVTINIEQLDKSSIKITKYGKKNEKVFTLNYEQDYTYEDDGWYHFTNTSNKKLHSNFATGSIGFFDLSFRLDKDNNLIVKSDSKGIIFANILVPFIIDSNVKLLKYKKL